MGQAGNDQNGRAPLRLSFTLTRLQWVINPPERLIIVPLFLTLAVLTPVSFVMSIISKAPLSVICVFGVGWVCSWIAFRRPILSFYTSLVTDKYFNTLLIEQDSVCVGIDGLQLRFPRNGLKVSRGLFGTAIVRWVPMGYSVTLPTDAIPFKKLKRLIETG